MKKLTACGQKQKEIMATKRPQAAPTKTVGIKTPKLTFKPNVEQDKI